MNNKVVKFTLQDLLWCYTKLRQCGTHTGIKQWNRIDRQKYIGKPDRWHCRSMEKTLFNGDGNKFVIHRGKSLKLYHTLHKN